MKDIVGIDERGLEEMLSEPTAATTEALAGIRGDIIVLGAGGKMGPTLAMMLKKAAPDKKICAVSRFSDKAVQARIEQAGVKTIEADLLDESQYAKLADRHLTDVKDLEDWKAKRRVYHKQLLEMFGLDPLPEKTDVAPVVTGKVEHEEFIVERIHFQSRPRLYLTANLYIPQAVAMAAEHTDVRLYQENDFSVQPPKAVAEKLGWPKKQFQEVVPQGDQDIFAASNKGR